MPLLTALRLENITKIYPGTIALDNVNLEVCYGEVHGLIGKNGAGKSTLVDVLAGLIQPTSGKMFIDNVEFESFSRMEAKRRSISIVTQEPEIILDITVAENLFLGDFKTKKHMIDWRSMMKCAADILLKYGLEINVELRAGDLSLSERQLLLIIKACIVEEPRIIILDESSAPLTLKDAELLKRIVHELRREQKAIIYISHHIDELLDICDRLTVLRNGRAVATKMKEELNHQALSTLIVGDGFSVSKTRHDDFSLMADEEILKIERLTRPGKYEDVSFTLHKGEIIGIAGLRGSGRTEILKGIAGIEPAEQGNIIMGQKRGLYKKPSDALTDGIAYLPEERELEGNINIFSIKENIVLNSLKQLANHGIIPMAQCEKKAQKIFDEVQMKAFSIEQNVEELSGGNKQKVVIGRIMAAAPKVYLLDEPTRGVDIGAKKSILGIVCEKIRDNAGVIITSPGLDDLIDICDRIFILNSGKITHIYNRVDFDERLIFMDIQGVSGTDNNAERAI